MSQHLANNLRHLLNAANLSENELARRTGIPQQMINRILNGQNQNPKIATLSPLAKFFMVSISQLIGDSIAIDTPALATAHLAWKQVPLITWAESIDFLQTKGQAPWQKTVMTDAPVSGNAFAIKMIDDSMLLRFAKDTLLIFDFAQELKHQDFILFAILPEKQVFFRQLLMKHGEQYIKALNPKSPSYKASILQKNAQPLGVLMQSRIDHFAE